MVKCQPVASRWSRPAAHPPEQSGTAARSLLPAPGNRHPSSRSQGAQGCAGYLLRLCSLKTVDYKLALAMDACRLPLQGLNHVLLQLLTFSTP